MIFKFASVSPSPNIFIYLLLFFFQTLDLHLLCAEMDVARRRAHIKQQAALKKQKEGQTPKGMGLTNPSTKRKQPEKTSRLPKKPKTVPEPVVGLQAKAKKTVT